MFFACDPFVFLRFLCLCGHLYIETHHSPCSCQGVTDSIHADVSHVKVAGRVREHGQDVELFLVGQGSHLLAVDLLWRGGIGTGGRSSGVLAEFPSLEPFLLDGCIVDRLECVWFEVRMCCRECGGM